MQALTSWTSTTPPCAGWWNASTDRDPDTRRYWSGTAWSAPCHVDAESKYHDRARVTPGESQFPEVEWRGLDANAMDGRGTRGVVRCPVARS